MDSFVGSSSGRAFPLEGVLERGASNILLCKPPVLPSGFNPTTTSAHTCVATNSFWRALICEPPEIAGGRWTSVTHTSVLPAQEITPPGCEERSSSPDHYLLQARSAVVVVGKLGEGS